MAPCSGRPGESCVRGRTGRMRTLPELARVITSRHGLRCCMGPLPLRGSPTLPPPPAPGSPTVGKRGKGRCKACCCCFCGGPSTAGAWRSRALPFVSFTCFWQGRERGLPAVHSARRYLSDLGTKTDTYILVTSTMYTRYAHYCVAYESVHMDDP